MENKLVEKPMFTGQITARIKSLGEIESNMQEVKDYAKSLNLYYQNLIFDENSMKQAKEEKAKVNKFKTKISDYRKDIIKQWKEPITFFETNAKETEQILTDVYNTINEQCSKFDNEKKQAKEHVLREFFNEYVKSNELDFVAFENVGLNITVSASEKSLKEQIVNFMDKIKRDLEVIDNQEFRNEILVEYKQSLDLNNSILTVNERKKRLQEEREKQEKLIQERLDAETKATAETLNNFIPQEEVKKEQAQEETIVAPTNITNQEKIYTLNFKVRGTMEQLKALKEYMKDNNLEVE